jgi:adenosylhomocysteine nucleosidase
MTRAAIIAAFPGELAPLVDGWQHEKRGRIDLWRWAHDEGEWIAACAGAGQHAATLAFGEAEKCAPPGQAGPQTGLESELASPIGLIISTGWAGALHRVMQPGQAYSVCGVIDANTGEMTPTAEWKDDIWLVTSPRVADIAEKHRLAAAYSAALVDMEAAAIARLAAMRNIPFYCTKGVSDGLNDRLPDFNRFLDAQGRLRLARLTLFALLRPRFWPSLIRMGENSSKAAHAIAQSVLDILDPKGIIRIRNGYPDRKH